jgi:hypothetical protein
MLSQTVGESHLLGNSSAHHKLAWPDPSRKSLLFDGLSESLFKLLED